MGTEKDFELTRCEVVLHEFNRAAIDQFLKANGHDVDNVDWSKKIKLVLHVIEMMQMRQTNEGADKVEEIKQAYLQEVSAVDAVVESLEAALKSDDSEYQIVTNEGQPDESSEWISREKFLEFMIENAINMLSGSVGYLFQDEENEQKKSL